MLSTRQALLRLALAGSFIIDVQNRAAPRCREHQSCSGNVHATVIRTSTGGVTIQDHPKSEHGFRYVTIPPNLAESLRRRQLKQRSNATWNLLDLVFPSSAGTVCDPNNAGKTWRKAANAIGCSWVTFKTFRKANATLLARTMDAETAAYQAGHSKVSMTRKHYVEEYKEVIDTRAVLGAFDAANKQAGPSRKDDAEI